MGAEPRGWHGPKSPPWLGGDPSWMALSLASAASVVLQGMFHAAWVRIKFCASFQTNSFPLLQANIGQKEDFEAARKKALALGAKKVTASLQPGALSPPCTP